MRILLSLRRTAPETAITPLGSKTRAAWLGLRAALLFATLAWLTVPTAQAQFRASIQGVVTDPTGAVIPGATLTLTDTGTNESKVTTSDASGIYNFNALPPDIFTLVVERDGFQKQVLNHLQLIPEQPNAINVVMAIGAATATVTVSASTATALDYETANNGISIDSNVIQHFPVFERDATSLVQMAPGTLADGSRQGSGNGFQAPGTQTGASSGGGGNLGNNSSIFATENGASANTNGGQFENNGYTVDGISTVSAVWGGSTVITPSEDSIGNVQIVTNAYDAENGRFDGAMTEITSKSGTNDLHGSFFVQINRPGLNAYQRWNGPASVGFSPARARPAAWPAQRRRTVITNSAAASADRSGRTGSLPSSPTRGKARTPPRPAPDGSRPRLLRRWLPADSIASTYLNFKGASVLGTVIASADLRGCGPHRGQLYCTMVTGGLNIGSPLTYGMGVQDLTYVSAADTRRRQWTLRTPPISPSTASATRRAATSSSTTDASMPT